MRFVFQLMVGALALAGCGTTGPVFQVEDGLPAWVSDAVDPASDNTPLISDPVVSFQLMPGERTSALRAGEDWRLGQSFLFGFDVRLDEPIPNQATVTLSRLTRITAPSQEIVSIKLDRQLGVTVFGRSCIAPEDLTEWHRVELRVRLKDDDKGFLEIFCDRKPVWAQNGLRTTMAPICRLADGCDDTISTPVRFTWNVGLMSDAAVPEATAVEMRRLHQRVIFYIPNRIGTL